MKTQKKAWKTPELVVLVRSKPEEAVLNACKGPGTASGPNLKSTCGSNQGVGCSAPGIS